MILNDNHKTIKNKIIFLVIVLKFYPKYINRLAFLVHIFTQKETNIITGGYLVLNNFIIDLY
jgi:hypothetical protein